MAIVEKVAHHSGKDPVELSPLYDSIDPDALDALVKRTDQRPDGGIRLSFDYDEYRVVVNSEGDTEFTITVDRST